MKKAVLSLSGGLDSTMLLLHLLSRRCEVRCYSFLYGQKHSRELESASKNIALLKSMRFPVEHEVIDLSSVFAGSSSSLHSQSGVEIPEGHYADENMKSTVVENRNVIFSACIYSKALAWANKTQENVSICLGIHSGDHAIYPDCREESRMACELAFRISNWGSERVHYYAPFVHKTKSEVLGEGISAMQYINLEYGSFNQRGPFTEEIKTQILKNTHTCYNPNMEGESCGKCGSCSERVLSFYENNLVDPIKYQNTWEEVLENALKLGSSGN